MSIFEEYGAEMELLALSIKKVVLGLPSLMSGS